MSSGSTAAVLLLAAACFALGVLLLRRLAGPRRLDLSLAFAGLTLGVVAVGWAALLLAEFGRFSLQALSGLWLASVVVLSIPELRRRRRATPAQLPAYSTGATVEPLLPFLPAWAERLFLGLWLVVAVWLFFRPHEYVVGAADAGVYVNLSASIADRGGIVYRDDFLAALDPALDAAVLRPLPDNPVAPYYYLPGFYVDGSPRGEVTPQFYPLHPVLQAVAFSLAGPLGAAFSAEPRPEATRAALLMPGLWALLGSLAVYLAVRQYAGWETAALALLGLSLNGLQVWFARYPTTEMLTQFLLWSGLWSAGLWLGGDRPARLWALTAGVALGAVFLVRVDLLVLLPVLGLLAFWLLAGGRPAPDRTSAIWFLAPLGLLVTHSFVHAWTQSRPYFVVHSGLGLRLLQVNWAIPLAAVLAGAVFLWLLRRYDRQFAEGYERYRRAALAALILATLIFAAYGWFVRPVVGQAVVRQDVYSLSEIPLTDHENWPRLAWYLSPAGVWLGVAGVCLLIWQVNRRTALMLIVGALFTALYLWSLRANPHHVYAMRRYIPVAIPFLTAAAATFIAWPARRPSLWWKRAAAALAVVWLAGLGWSARGLISQVDYRGMTAELARLNAAFEPDSVLLFDDRAVIDRGDFFGTPLRFLFGHDVLPVRDRQLLDGDLLARSIRFWQNSGRAVYWIGDPAWLEQQGLSYRASSHTLTGNRLEERYDRRPTAVQQDEWMLPIAAVEPEP